jgi:CBS domain-containing protein
MLKHAVRTQGVLIFMGIVFAVKHIMSRDIISVKNNASVIEAVSVMVENDIGSVVVTKDGEPVGILTERDIMKRCCPERLCNQNLKVEKIMSTPLVTIDANASLGEAATLMMDKNIRRLLVVEKGKIVGIITQKDVLRGTLNYFMAVASL